jgi:acetylornithine/N-succinyldiaminopimelate aminotransferase
VQEELATKLVENTFADKVFFTNSGTESIECAIKMARKFFFEKGFAEKKQIITFEGSFHGRSMAAISASGAEKLTKGFGPLLPGFKSLPFGNLTEVEFLNSDQICAVLIEPIQGEGGIRPCEKEFLIGLRKICDEKNILLILDEIQSGIGRSGDFFSYEHYGVKPDIVAVAKGIGGGFPLGCCLASAKAASGMTLGSHGSTFGGNPLACAVGIAVVNQIFSDGFLNSVKEKGIKFFKGLEALVLKNPTVFESVRGRGLMLGLKCKVDNSIVIEKAYKKKLLLVPAGDNVVRLLPPLNISEEDLSLAMEGLKSLTFEIGNGQ